MKKRYPFKFLDSYSREDSDIFFGRDEEIAALYEMVFQTDLLLVQGPSGVGKTSLIKCGLASKFQSHDWLALDIRRGSDLNDSLRKALLDAGGSDTDTPEEEDLDWLDQDLSEDTPTAQEPSLKSPLTRSLRALYLKYFKPIYLIFDQFEELYTIGNKAEQDAFVEQIKEILRVRLPVKIILSIREEYLGHLYDFERKVPELQRKKLRVEPMNLDKVKEVIFKACNLKNGVIHLKSGQEEAIATGVFERIKEKEKTLVIELPYLQVFLDKLYLQTTGDESRQADATFSLETLNSLGDMGDILRDFLDEQVLKISSDLNQKPEIIWQLLSPFVTLDGTKEPLSEQELRLRLKNHPPELLNEALNAFFKARILRYSEQDQRFEVKHDSLAKRIHAKRSDDDIALLEVQRLIKNQLLPKPDVRELFTEKQLGFIEPMKEKLTLLPEEIDWIHKSEARLAEEIEAQTRALEMERQLKETAIANARRARTWSYLAGVVAVLSIGLALFAWKQYNAAEEAKVGLEGALKKAKASEIKADSSAKEAMKSNQETKKTLTQLKKEQEQTEKARQQAAQGKAEAEKNLKAAKIAEAKADSSSKVAKQREDEAKTALDNTRQALSEVVRLSLLDADKLILQLEYEAALKKMYSLIPLKASQDTLATALLEPAFWYGETGELDKAWGILDSAYVLSGKRLEKGKGDLVALRGAIRQMNPERYAFLESRYFPQMVEVPGGTFKMGDNNGQSDEKPAHEVEVSTFKMAATETTWWQYALYAQAEAGVELPEFPSSWGAISGDNPVINVSWYEVLEYANWVSDRRGVKRAYPKTGADAVWTGPEKPGYRLPTEAEWEYAARGGNQEKYAGTDNQDELGDYAWYTENSGSRTRPVRGKKANSFGLYDLSGNVWEWCWDWYDDEYYEACKESGEVINPIGPKRGTYRVFRGGGWSINAENCRSAYRYDDSPGGRDYDVGFRLVFVP